MKKASLIFFLLLQATLIAQNNLLLLSANGQLFSVYLNDRLQNRAPQASVLLRDLKKDTVFLKIEFTPGNRLGFTAYLLNKGRHTSGKEFSYRIAPGSTRLKVEFLGMDSIAALPEPLVPKEPLPDTSSMYRNTRLGQLCEIKDRKITYFNNRPVGAKCTVPMPADYVGYVNYLMNNANTEEDRVKIADNVCRNNCLSVAQLKTLLNNINLELNKLKIARLGFNSLSDTAGKNALLGVFRIQASANELKGYFLRAGTPQRTCRTLTGIDKTARLLETLKSKANDAERMQALKAEKGNDCYTTGMVSGFMQTMLHDREKLETARLFYPQLYNPENVQELETLFENSQTVKELRDYVELMQNK